MTGFVSGNRIKLLRTGTEYFPALEAAFDAARREICIETYIFEDDITGRRIAQALAIDPLHERLAATLGGFWNYEAIQLQQLHKHPVTIPVDQAGVPEYNELVLVVREDEAHRRGQDLRAFLRALTTGEHEVRANPAAAAALLVKANPSLEPKLQLASIEQTLPAAVAAEAGKPYGWQSPTAWAAFGSWMFAHKLLKNNPSTGLPPFSNEFLPGQGI